MARDTSLLRYINNLVLMDVTYKTTKYAIPICYVSTPMLDTRWKQSSFARRKTRNAPDIIRTGIELGGEIISWWII